MLSEEAGRLVVRCDCCPARLDLGPASAVRARNRTPSGWIRTATDTHYCPLCSPEISIAAMYAFNSRHKVQPLLGAPGGATRP